MLCRQSCLKVSSFDAAGQHHSASRYRSSLDAPRSQERRRERLVHTVPSNTQVLRYNPDAESESNVLDSNAS